MAPSIASPISRPAPTNSPSRNRAFSALSPGELSTAAFVQAAAALTSEQRIIHNQSTGLVSYDADGSGGGAAIAVAQLNAGQVLKAQDIKVY